MGADAHLLADQRGISDNRRRSEPLHFLNIDHVWAVTVTALNAKGVLRARRYISGSGNSDCMILPLLGWPGSTVTITGVIQDTLAIPGFAVKNARANLRKLFQRRRVHRGPRARGLRF